MTAALMQKLLISMIVLTSFFLTFIFCTYYDLVRPIGNSLFQLIPGILFFLIGIATGALFCSPTFIFNQICPIKSGFAKELIGTTIFPLVSATARTLSIIAGLSSLLDKMWFYWRQQRIFLLARLLSVICMLIIAGNAVFTIIAADQSIVLKNVTKINYIGTRTGIFLGAVFLLITILALPYLCGKKRSTR